MQHEPGPPPASSPVSAPRSERSPARDASVAWINVAPVKALALAAPERVEVGPAGVEGDRRFALVDAAGTLVNGKRAGRLVQLVPSFDAATRRLSIRFPDGTLVEGSTEAEGEPIDALFFGRFRPGRLVAGPWSDAISVWLGAPLRLIELGAGSGTDRGHPGGSVTILSAAALTTLAAEGGLSDALDGRRFRMTFGVEGIRAHEEDAWIGCQVRIGAALVRVEGNVGRCAVTTQDPDTGVPDFDTLGALARSRGGLDTSEPLPMGVWATVIRPGQVGLGDAVEVREVDREAV